MITVIILLVAYASKGISDRISFKPDDFWFIENKKIQDWILGRGDFYYDKRSWLTKHLFSFLADGWHFFDSIVMVCLCVLVTMLTGLAWWSVIVFYFAGGVVLEMVYNIKKRK